MQLLLLCVAKLSKLYGPPAPVIVPKTSDGYACVSYNLKSLSSVLEKPKSSTIYNSHRINKGVTATLQHLLQNFTSDCRTITTINLQIMIKLTLYKLNLNDGSRVKLQKIT
jgi:hypothetical protein